jgi:O-antigen ligase
MGSVKIYFRYALFLVVGTMPFHSNVNSASIIVLSIVWMFEGNFAAKRKLFLTRPLISFFLLFYFLFLLGMIYTDNVAVGLFNLEKKLPLLSLPVLIGTSLSFDKKMMRDVLFFFIVTCFVTSLICLGNAFFQVLTTGSRSFFFHDELSSMIGLQPPYFGLYISFSILILIFFAWNNRKGISKRNVVVNMLLVCYFFFFIVLLSARTSSVFLLLFFFCFALYAFILQRRMIWGFVIFIFAAVTLVLLIYISPYLNDRFIKPIISDISVTEGGKETGLSIRLVKWKCSIEGIKGNWLFGVGTGDTVDYLVDCYQKTNFWGMYPQYRFNSHNQFFETGLTLGMFGLLSFLICIGGLSFLGFRNGDYLCISFVILFCFSCLTESLLERQWGIVFFAFFASLFSFAPTEK